MSQLGQRRVTPHARQWIAPDSPRLLRRRIARPPSLPDCRELGEERRGERIAGLPPQVDEPHRRKRRSDPHRELQALEARPALRARSGAAVHRDGALERRALRGDRSRVVARVRLLLEGSIVLLVDDDEPEPLDRREDGRARADDDPGLP